MNSQMNYEWLSDVNTVAVNRIKAHSGHTITGNDKCRISLNGMWKMHYAPNLSLRPVGFEAPDFDISGFDDVKVPMPIQMQGYGHPAYNNFMYPWDGHEEVKSGDVPKKFNPTASYVKEFVIPSEWAEKNIYISFQGVESGMALWLNGKFIGYSEDSFTPHEFDLSDAIDRTGINRLAVQVYRFTSSSWLEDQDFFRFSGIFREVFLYATEKAHVFDVFAKGLLNEDNISGALDLELTIDKYAGFKGVVNVDALITYDNVEVLTEELFQITEEGRATYNKTIDLEEVAPWSAEKPNLYRLSIILTDEDGAYIETAGLDIGFRRFELSDGVLKINGRRIVFNGVNRHEMDCRTGRSVTYEETENDIINMKRHNINAIRTCHYPDQTFLYDLCDKYGLYVIAECNLETHGTWSVTGHPDENTLPGSNPLWEKPCIDRATSLVELDKNHPSIVFWSCGNESCGGKNIFLMSEVFRNRDNTRLVHYEGVCHDRTYDKTSDVESQMYTKPWHIDAFLKDHPEKPFILCEYMHAMGNSLGAMDEYTEKAYTNRLFQGGFIWDYIDQAFLKKNRYGEEFMAYGGDFGDRPNDYNFCGDGIVFADRTNSPKMQDVKYCYRGIDVQFANDEATITNRYLFTNLDEFIMNITLFHNGTAINNTYRLLSLDPDDTVTVPVFDEYFEKPVLPGEYTVRYSFCLSEDTLYAESMFEQCFGEYSFTVDTDNVGLDMLTEEVQQSLRPVKIIDCDYNYTFEGSNFKYIFSKRSGGFISMTVNGKEMFDLSPKPNFWRAPVDNDMGNGMPYKLTQWKMASMYNTVINFECEGNKVKCTYGLAGLKDVTVDVTYTVADNGIIRVDMEYKGYEDIPNLPEFGMLFTIPADYENVKYYGKGPAECMWDRSNGARLGLFGFKASENVTPYLMPQECGNRTDVRFAEVTDELGRGLMFASERCELSVLPYTPHELENAKHYHELPDIHYTIIRVNYRQMGVGGDDTWGAPVHDQYKIYAKDPIKFTFFIGNK